MTEQLYGRALIESRFGRLGKGRKIVTIGDAEYDMPALLARMDLAVEDIRAIDIVQLNINHFALRYYDLYDQRVVAHEFDASFRFLNETRGHVAEWIGEDAYYDEMKGLSSAEEIFPQS
jgi:S-adenosylmethionine:diacylglycerol 3-amino-3-carboxypropyl transferase